ncbi:hypothetical protein SEA_WHEELBITE_85 [Arthrobacter phage Wheelbite]|uniref:Uncharacterized protein n=1 Tax=Arthrobacter phage Wheelbite TaxID=2015873 RepID=A0A222ZHF7_9CAUD|nr:hypothetical protein KMD23_gp85 [Arthrobacter phage Wheelbite]ASR84173.1 hypothetical protein SEA_WHEELBITE_85 [Arthrobacter phage Wheelbite]
MNRDDTIRLLAYVQAADNRTVGEADILFWMDTLPENLDLETAKAGVRVFFAEAATRADERIFFTTRHLMRCVKTVKHRAEVEAAKARAERPAITQRHRPPEGGWRSLVPQGPPKMTEKHEVYTQSIPIVVPNYGAALRTP